MNAADPDLRSIAYGCLGLAYRQMGRMADAKRCFEESLRLTPERSIAIVELGLIALQEDDFTQAVSRFRQATALHPTAVGYLLLARALQQASQPTEAAAAREAATKLSSNLAEAQNEAQELLAGK